MTHPPATSAARKLIAGAVLMLAACNGSGDTRTAATSTLAMATTTPAPTTVTPSTISTTAVPTTTPAPTAPVVVTTTAPSTTATPAVGTILGTADNPEPINEQGVRDAITDYARRITECSAQLTDCDYTILEERLTGRVLQFEVLNHGSISSGGNWVEFNLEVRSVTIDTQTETATAAICEYGQILDDPTEVKTLLERNELSLRYSAGRWYIYEDDVWPDFVIGTSTRPECDE